ncbi:hypothetical protein UQW22_12025 [Isoptericola halotolerans]|uniref:hypothetical protein n=1 Tax=Isoptericola halotolerans TaxID=300560 RepID=UPI00388F24CE
MTVSGLVVAVGLLAAGAAVLRDLDGVVLLTGAEPFTGHWVLRAGTGTAVAAAVAAAVAMLGPRLATTLRWPALLATACSAALVFTVALGATVSWPDLAAPLGGPHEYLNTVPVAAADPVSFVATFTSQISGYPIHVRGHPPGFVLVLAGLDSLGLGGAGWASVLVILAGTSSVVAVATTLRRLGGTDGERSARQALPAMVLAPATLWVATSADAFFAAVLAWGVAALAVGSTTPGRTARWTATLGAGLLLGWCPFLSYGLLHMGMIALVVGWVTRRWAPTVVAAGVVVATVIVWGAAGLWLWDGIVATHAQWDAGSGTGRPYLYFLVADVVLLGVLIGPAGVAGLACIARGRRLDRATTAFVLVGVASALLGALGGFERGEVERIWLPLAFWVAPAAALVGAREHLRSPEAQGLPQAQESPEAATTWRWWLGAQAATTVLLAVVLRSPW